MIISLSLTVKAATHDPESTPLRSAVESESSSESLSSVESGADVELDIAL